MVRKLISWNYQRYLTKKVAIKSIKMMMMMMKKKKKARQINLMIAKILKILIFRIIKIVIMKMIRFIMRKKLRRKIPKQLKKEINICDIILNFAFLYHIYNYILNIYFDRIHI